MSKKTEKKEGSKSKESFTKLGVIFLAILIVANTIQIANMGSIVERVDRYNQGVVDELGGFRQDVIAFGNDMNEMRSYLLLPTKNYSFMEENEEVEEEDKQETSKTQQALYQFLGQYAEEAQAAENYEKAKQQLTTLHQNPELTAALTESELVAGPVEQTEASSSFKISAAGNPLFSVLADPSSTDLKVQSILGTETLNETNTLNDLSQYVTSNKDKVITAKELLEAMKAGVLNLQNNQNVAAGMAEKNISFDSTPTEDEAGFHYHFLNVEGSTILTVDVSREGEYGLADQKFESEEQLAAALTEALNNVDASTAMEQLVNASRNELESVIQEEPFQELLKTNGLTIKTEPREEYNKLIYDVTNQEGQTEFSLFIELSSGMVKLLQDNQEYDLNSFLAGSKKKP
ncbi:hypothetical protein KC725_04075 [Candidatus Peregrinibacteria bacterium]|nr:hypothetical protein [Candidatus Peregrinibacteria bacterium]